MSRIYGLNAVTELVDAAPGAVAALLVSGDLGAGQAAALDLVERARGVGITVTSVSSEALRRRSGGRGGASIAAELRVPEPIDLQHLDVTPGATSAPLIVALDQVTDPHNLGAVLRSAAAFGATAVVVTKDRSAPLSDAAIRASAGGAAYIPLVRVTNLARTLRSLAAQGLWTVATAADAPQPLWEVDLTLPTVIVLGAEGRGLRPNVRKRCEISASLPLSGPIRSLNVSVAAGIALAEAARQRVTAP